MDPLKQIINEIVWRADERVKLPSLTIGKIVSVSFRVHDAKDPACVSICKVSGTFESSSNVDFGMLSFTTVQGELLTFNIFRSLSRSTWSGYLRTIDSVDLMSLLPIPCLDACLGACVSWEEISTLFDRDDFKDKYYFATVINKEGVFSGLYCQLLNCKCGDVVVRCANFFGTNQDCVNLGKEGLVVTHINDFSTSEFSDWSPELREILDYSQNVVNLKKDT